MKYELVNLQKDNKDYSIVIKTDDDGIISYVPTDPANSDYQAYLKWLEENN